MTNRGPASPSGKQPPDTGEPSADPFARIADALHEEPAAKLKRPPRRSRPSFSELAPVLPPTPTAPVVTPPPVVVNRVQVVGSGPSEPPRVNPLPFVPSVIVSEEPPSLKLSRPTSNNGPTTLRVIRKEAPPPRALRTSTVLFLLGISLTVFAVGVAALFFTRSPAPRVNAADLPPPPLSQSR